MAEPHLSAKEEAFVAQLDAIESVVADPMKFKAKLAIGEDAYTSLRLKKRAYEAYDTLGAAATAATVAKSGLIASTFFAPSGVLGVLGLGSAATPFGWVVAAGVVTGGTWYGISRVIKKNSSDRVTVIPNFINTPLDVLAIGLFDLTAPLALKLARMDGNIDQEERANIDRYYRNEWGYDPEFVRRGLDHLQERLDGYSVRKLAENLVSLQSGNRDCNYEAMARELVRFLTDVMEADGKVDAREQNSINAISRILQEGGKSKFRLSVERSIAKVGSSVSRLRQRLPMKRSL